MNKYQSISRGPLLLVGLSAVVFVFYFTGIVLFTDIYRYAFVGAVYEILGLPMMALLAGIVIFSVVQLVKRGRFPLWSLLLALVFSAGTILVLTLT